MANPRGPAWHTVAQELIGALVVVRSRARDTRPRAGVLRGVHASGLLLQTARGGSWFINWADLWDNTMTLTGTPEALRIMQAIRTPESSPSPADDPDPADPDPVYLDS